MGEYSIRRERNVLFECLTLEQILNYLEDRTDLPERAKIAAHLAECPLCTEAIEGYQTISSPERAKELVRAIKLEACTRIAKKKPRNTEWKKYYSIAAVLLLVSTVAWYIFNSMPVQQPGLFDQYYALYPNTIPIVRGEETGSNFLNAMSAYEMEDFSTALSLLESELTVQPENSAVLFYAGTSCLELRKIPEAISYFQNAQNSHNPEFSDHAGWYLGLAYLKSEDLVNAKKVFQEIVLTKKAYKNRALEILKKIAVK